MGTETLFLALLVFLTVIAYMIAINAHGVWRLTLSFLLATCMLGGTVWAIILQYSTTTKTAVLVERRRLEAERKEFMQDKEQALAKEQMGNAARASQLVAQAKNLAASLQAEALQDPAYTYEQLVARSAASEQRFAALQSEVDAYGQVVALYPDAAKLLTEAMAELKEACKLYRSYYYAENSAAEQARERQMKQRAGKARELLAKADKVLESAVD